MKTESSKTEILHYRLTCLQTKEEGGLLHNIYVLHAHIQNCLIAIGGISANFSMEPTSTEASWLSESCSNKEDHQCETDTVNIVLGTHISKFARIFANRNNILVH